MHAGFRRARGVWRPLAVASGPERRAWSATERGGLPGGRARSALAPRGSRGPAVPKVGAQQPLIGCPPAGHPPALNRSGC